MGLYIVIAVAVFILLIAAGAVIVYFSRRFILRTSKKTSAMGDLVNVDVAGQIIPEEGDPVEWGIGANQFAFNDEAVAHELRTADDNLVHWFGEFQPRRRSADLLAL